MYGSQQSNLEFMEDLTGLTHDIFVGQVVNNVIRECPTADVFKEAGPGEYRLEGPNMVFATDLKFKTGAMATSGQIPDHQGIDAVQGKIGPVRRYERIGIDNLVEKQASGPGAFEDLGDRIFDHLWDAWASMEARQSIGASSGLVAKVDARSSSTVFTIKDGYGNEGTNPLTNLSEGSIIGWYDVSESQVGGAAKITNTGIDYDTNEITVNSAATWETAIGNVIAADDLIFFATTNDTSREYFTLERNLAPNGIGTILDPFGEYTTVHDISETDHRRWKPFRKDSVTCDHLEFTEHWLQLGQKRGFPVSPSTDVVVTFPSVVAQVARSLVGFQQQDSLGGEMVGGYSGVSVRGIPFVEDSFFYHNVAVTVCKEKLFRIPLGGQADFWGEDGSMWSRIANWDGKDAYVVDYLNFMSNGRGSHGVLANITTDLTDDDFTNVPSY